MAQITVLLRLEVSAILLNEYTYGNFSFQTETKILKLYEIIKKVLNKFLRNSVKIRSSWKFF